MVLNEDNLAVEEYEQPYSKKFRLATNFCGCLSLRNGMWGKFLKCPKNKWLRCKRWCAVFAVIGLTDLAFGLLMAFSYFREPEVGRKEKFWGNCCTLAIA